MSRRRETALLTGDWSSVLEVSEIQQIVNQAAPKYGFELGTFAFDGRKTIFSPFCVDLAGKDEPLVETDDGTRYVVVIKHARSGRDEEGGGPHPDYGREREREIERERGLIEAPRSALDLTALADLDTMKALATERRGTLAFSEQLQVRARDVRLRFIFFFFL